MKLAVWQAVKVKTETHPRFGAAGTVFAVNEDKPDEVVVRFDLDNQKEAVAVIDLQVL